MLDTPPKPKHKHLTGLKNTVSLEGPFFVAPFLCFYQIWDDVCHLYKQVKFYRKTDTDLRVSAERRSCRVTVTSSDMCEGQHHTVKREHTYVDTNKFQFNTFNYTSLMEKTTVTNRVEKRYNDIYQAVASNQQAMPPPLELFFNWLKCVIM